MKIKLISTNVNGFEIFKAVFWLIIGMLYLFDFQTADLNDVVLFIALVLSDAANSRAKGL